MAPKVSYGTPNMEMIGRWLQLSSEEDGPFWAVNLMKYNARAAYDDGGDHGLTGREADDAYSPLGPLAAIGAVVVLHGDVLEQHAGEPAWDRIGIVRYPSRRSFLEMQERDDFKRQHVHKSAGMAFTIVMACTPRTGVAPTVVDGPLVMRVVPEGAALDDTSSAMQHVATLDVEGVIIGDDRRWSQVRFDVARDRGAAPDPGAGGVAVVVERAVDRLAPSILDA